MTRVIMHVDMNAFFASVEQVANPALRGLPVLVAGDTGGRSVVSAASYEARRYGVRSGMPLGQARRLCPQAVVVRARHREYARVSRELRRILQEFTPLVEPVSIDEAFLDLTGCEAVCGPPLAAARSIKARIRAATGLSCSIGIAPNRFLAKMASDLEKPDGLVYLHPEDVQTRLWPLPVGRLHGVGEKTAARLEALGLVTIGALAQVPPAVLVRELGPGAERLRELAWGADATPVVAVPAPAKSLSHETTLEADSDDRDFIESVLLDLSDRVARRARRAGVRGRTVELKLRDARFDTITRSVTLAVAVELAEDIYAAARKLLDRHWDGRLLRLLGVGLSQLVSAATGQLPLADPAQRRRRLAEVGDALRDRFGETALTRARLVKVPRRDDP